LKSNNLIDTKVYSIVVTYNSSKFIKECIDSLIDSEYKTEIIVVDNASSDNTIDIIEKNKDILIVRQHKNIGFGVANNIGISKALEDGADLIFLLNQDAFVKSDTIKILVESIYKEPNLAVLSPLHLNNNGDEFDYNFLQNTLSTSKECINDLYFGNLKKCYEIKFVNAAAWLITRECLEKVGGFDPLFFMYGEDNDYCNRVKYHNLNIGLVPKASIFHARHKTIIYRNSFLQNVRSNIIKLQSHILVELKKPVGNFARRLLFINIEFIRMILNSIFELDFASFISTNIVIFNTIISLPKIWVNYKRSLEIGPHWLDYIKK